MSGPIYIFAGGGTGGHLYPALAVAEELMRLQGEARIAFACSNRAIDRRVLDVLPYAIVPQPVRPLPHGARGWGGFLRAWAASKLQARQMVRDLKPAAVLGMGGFAAAPVVEAAASRRIPTAMLNPDAVPGKANKHLARRVDAIFTQFPQTTETFPPAARGKVHCVGCPVARRFLEASREEALRHFGLRGDRRTLVVLGGSQGAGSINQALAALAADLSAVAENWQILHITGAEKGSGTFSAAEKVPDPFSVKLEYCHEMHLAYAGADLALCRGGAATIAELDATATPAVILPYPYHKDQQQRLNAGGLVAAGSAVLVEDKIDPAANAASLRQSLLPLMADASKLDEMKAKARQSARTQAAAEVARWLIETRKS